MSLEAKVKAISEVAGAHASEVDESETFPEDAVDALRRSGLLGLTLPTDVGGLGQGPKEFAQTVEQLAAACGSTAMIYLMHVSAAMVIAKAPPPGLPKVLNNLADGSWLATLAFSERGSRSHFWAPVSKALPEPDDVVHIKAEKSWVTSARHADVFVVSALAPDDQSATDTNLYALRSVDSGINISGPWHGLGLRANESCPVGIDAKVEEARRLDQRGDGFGLMMQSVLPWFNLGNAAVSLGLARCALDAGISHCSSARFDHLDSGLADLPTIRAKLAKSSIAWEAQQAYLNQTAEKLADPDDTTPLAVLGVKASANEAALQITDEMMRVCGGAAFSKHLPVERAFRDARAGHVMAPTSDVLFDFYGKAICGQKLF